jgi:hypothetical protein
MKVSEMEKEDKKYYFDLIKDTAFFVSGIFLGPIIDFAFLMKKHAPILRKKISKKMNLKEVK